MGKKDILKTLQRAEDAPPFPLPLFSDWMKDAEKAEPSDPNAMCVATIGPDGLPQARILLLKGFDENGFVFFTNMDSRKGTSLKKNPYAALNFHWKTLSRAVRIEGPVTPIDPKESDAYFATRPQGSRIGAWASMQSRPLASRQELEDMVAACEKKFGGKKNGSKGSDIPRPPYWYGSRVAPERIEFWHAGDFRLHTRLLYTKTKTGWKRQLLYP